MYSPPLKVWLWLSMLFVVFQTVIFLYNKDLEQQDLKLKSEMIDTQIQKLENDFAKADATALKVVAIGSSLIEEGLACSEELKTVTDHPFAHQIQLNIIADYPDPLAQLVKEKNIIAKLLALKPDLVCIQTELAAINFTGKNTESINNRSVLYQFLQKLAHSNRASLHRFKEGFKTRKRDRIIQRDTLNHFPDKRRVKDFEELSYVYDGFQQLQKAGIKIVIVDVPRPIQVEKLVYTKAFKDDLKQVMRKYQDRFHIDYWPYTGSPLHYKYFKDYGHLNEMGKTVYSHWFVKELAKENPEAWNY